MQSTSTSLKDLVLDGSATIQDPGMTITKVLKLFLKVSMLTQKQALIQALQLAITAPTDELSQECVSMAESFSVGLTDDEIETCKLIASSSTTC